MFALFLKFEILNQNGKFGPNWHNSGTLCKDFTCKQKAGVYCGPCNGRLSFEDDLKHKVCFTAFHKKPASALSLLKVWSPWGNPGMVRCLTKNNLGSWIHPAAHSALSKQ